MGKPEGHTAWGSDLGLAFSTGILPTHLETLRKAKESYRGWLKLEVTSAFFLWGPQAGQYQAREGRLET